MDGLVIIWSSTTGKTLAKVRSPVWWLNLQFSDDLTELVAEGISNPIGFAWDTSPLMSTPNAVPTEWNNQQSSGKIWSDSKPDMFLSVNYLATDDRINCEARITDLANLNQEMTLELETSPEGMTLDTTSCWFDEKSNTLITFYNDFGKAAEANNSDLSNYACMIRVWDVSSKKERGNPINVTSNFKGVRFSPSGDHFLICDAATGAVYDTSNLNRVETQLPELSSVSLVDAEFADEHRVYMLTHRGISLWDYSTDRLIRSQSMEPASAQIRAQFRYSRNLALSNDREAIAIGFGDKVFVLKADTLEPLFPPFVYINSVEHVGFSPDSRHLLVVHRNTAHVWDAATGKRVGRELSHDGRISTALFSPDSRFIVTCSRSDASSRVWDRQTGQPVSLPIVTSKPDYAQFDAKVENVLILDDELIYQQKFQPFAGTLSSLQTLAELVACGQMVDEFGAVEALESFEMETLLKNIPTQSELMDAVDIQQYYRIQSHRLEIGWEVLEAEKHVNSSSFYLSRLLKSPKDLEQALGNLLEATTRWMQEERFDLAEKYFAAAISVGDRSLPLLRAALRCSYELQDWATVFQRSEILLNLRPEDRDAMLLRGAAYAEVSEWQNAMAMFNSLSNGKDSSLSDVVPFSMSQIGAKDISGFEAGARKAIDGWHDELSAEERRSIAWLCLWRKIPQLDYQMLHDRLSEMKDPLLLGAVELRQDDYSSSLSHLEVAVSEYDGDGFDAYLYRNAIQALLFAGIASAKIGMADQAKGHLARADELIAAKMFDLDWEHRLVFPLLRDELAMAIEQLPKPQD